MTSAWLSFTFFCFYNCYLEYESFLLSAMPKINWKAIIALVCKAPTGFVEWFTFLSLEVCRGNVLGEGHKSVTIIFLLKY